MICFFNEYNEKRAPAERFPVFVVICNCYFIAHSNVLTFVTFFSINEVDIF